jgi:aminopeptidase N
MAVADLTRDEARERAGLLAVESYDVELDFTRGEEVFASTSVITFTAVPGAATFVELTAERLHRAVLNGAPLDPAGYADGRLPLPDLARDNVLTVTADFAYTHESAGIHRAVDPADGKVYLYSNLCPADSRRVFANFDQPDLKAVYAFTVIAPEHWLVLSNAAAPEPQPDRDAVARWRFPATARLSGYVAAIIAGEYAYVTQPFKTRRGQSIPLGVACRASLARFLEAEDMFETTMQGLDFYTDLFDMDFPFPKYDQIFVPEFSVGAMENAACVTFNESFLFRSRTTSTMYEMRADVILHEMAHMWFGDYVTMRWWGDLWLNESFAEFCGTFVSAEATKYTDAWTTFANSRKAWGYEEDQLPSSHPIVGDTPTLADVMANFDGISYAKGASVLKQLVAYLGREQFFAGVRAYFAEHAWGNAELSDLIRAWEQASGKDLAAWSAAWLETAGPNTLSPEFELDDEGRFTAFAVRQRARPEFPTLRPHHIAIGFYDRTGGVLTRSHRIEVDAHGALTAVPDLVGRPRPDVILLNDDDLGYAITRFDPASLAALAEGIGTFEQPLTRAVSWTAAIDMAAQGELAMPAFFRMLTGAMRVESSVPLLQIVLRTTRQSLLSLADPQWLPTGLAALAGLAADLIGGAEPGGDFQLAWAQLLTWTATTPEQIDLVRGLLDGSVRLPGLTVDVDLRWALLDRLAVTGHCDEARIDQELARDDTDTGRRRARALRAALPDAAHKAEAWRLLTAGDELGHQGIGAVAGGFAEPEHAAQLAPYVAAYFEVLPRLWAERSDSVRSLLAERLFPLACAGPELIERGEAFLAAPDLDPALRRIVVEELARAKRIIRSRALG